MPLAPFSRRSLLIGGGIGAGLVVGYRLWPRASSPMIAAGQRKHLLGEFVRVAEDGIVTVAVPQVELGHGVFTGLAQIVADALGADWSKVGVEVALPGALADNTLLEHDWGGATLGFAATGGSTSVRGYEARLRDAGAAARALLCAAAAARWGVDADAVDTHGGYAWHGRERIGFGALAADAARAALPADIVPRDGRANRLIPASLPRIDVPAKTDGTAQFAGDIRLPGLVYASIASGPIGAVRLVGIDRTGAQGVRGLLQLIETEHWVAAVATDWWAANRAIEAMRPRFETHGPLADDRGIDAALTAALARDGERLVTRGDIDALPAGPRVTTRTYVTRLAAHAAVETATATATIEDGALRLWTNTQAPGLAAAAAARATGLSPEKVVVQPMLVGGAWGARFEVEIVEQVALLARWLTRPVQLTWSRAEEMRRATYRAPTLTRLTARTGAGGRIEAWSAQVAAPSSLDEQRRRVTGEQPAQAGAEAAAVVGAEPPYAIPLLTVDHHPATIGVPTGAWRGRAHVANAFAAECFVDELAEQARVDPFSYRMAMLGGDVRLARCLARVVAIGGWQGGAPGSNQGVACHAMAGSHAAVLAEAYLEGDRIRVARLVAVVDVGRVINPDIVRAQVIGGLVFGLSGATGAPVSFAGGLARPTRYGALGLPRIADCPDILVELIQSGEPSGGASEVAVPPVAPAIAGALFAATGVRRRRLPLMS